MKRTFVQCAAPLLTASLCLLTHLRANEPGGGSGGAAVTLTDKGDSVVLDNGIVSATIAKAGARITSLVYRGNQMVDRQGLYWSMGGDKGYQNPSKCAFSVTTQTPEMVDVSATGIGKH